MADTETPIATSAVLPDQSTSPTAPEIVETKKEKLASIGADWQDEGDQAEAENDPANETTETLDAAEAMEALAEAAAEAIPTGEPEEDNPDDPPEAVKLALQASVPPPQATVVPSGTKTASVAANSASQAKKVKKESFKWNTPADEFADDVGSDEEGEYLTTDDLEDNGDEIIIHLGEGADREEIERKLMQIKGETKEEVQRYLDTLEMNNGGNAPIIIDGRLKKKKPTSKQKYECPKCSKVWNWPWELRRHVLTHYKEKEREATTAFKCETCGKGFQWKRDLAQHRRLHTGEKLLVCSVCEKKFTTRQALLHHVVVHTGEKPFQCAMCGNRFTQPANLRTHMKKKHGGKSGVEGNRCPHCQESFPSIIAVHQHILEDHQNIVAEEREEQEVIRLKREQEKAEKLRLREERRKYRTEKKKERAEYSEYKTKGLQEWEINYEFYIGEGLVKGVDWDRTPSNGELGCDICDRKFGWRYEVMFHNLCHMVDEHGNTKNRVCPECDTTFKVPIGLKHHLLLHTNELPFLCLHCWRSFSSHIDLKLHIRKEHLFHLEPEKKKAPTPKRKTKAIETPTPTRKKAKIEVQEPAEEEVQEQHHILTHEGMELMVAQQQDANGEQQTILLNSDGTIMHAGDQDMIVVIQSDDYDQNNGLIVVDPSQLQQVVGADGMPVTVLQTQDGNMILGQTEDGGNIIMSEDGTAHQIQEQQQLIQGEGQTIAVQGEDGRIILADGTHVQAINGDGTPVDGETTHLILSDGMQVVTDGSGTETRVIVSDSTAAEDGATQAMMVTSEMAEANPESIGVDDGTGSVISMAAGSEIDTKVNIVTMAVNSGEVNEGQVANEGANGSGEPAADSNNGSS